jgi:hypothetical protein
MSEPVEDGLDATVARYLKGEFRFVSRRSALERLTRAVFGLLGVGIGSTVLPFNVPEAEAQTPNWRHCGLHGYLCQGGCTGGVTGSGPIRAWQVCCKDPSCNKWFCCTYADQCGSRGPTWGTGCGGVTPSGPAWCGNTTGAIEYICTRVSCATSGGTTTAAACSCSGTPTC